eukprot:2178240-Alexandrium_andersonii.AAC.1
MACCNTLHVGMVRARALARLSRLSACVERGTVAKEDEEYSESMQNEQRRCTCEHAVVQER